MKRTRVDAVILTADLCEIYGSCEACPGVGNYDPETMKAGNTSANVGDPVFCIHHCHEKPIGTA